MQETSMKIIFPAIENIEILLDEDVEDLKSLATTRGEKSISFIEYLKKDYNSKCYQKKKN